LRSAAVWLFGDAADVLATFGFGPARLGLAGLVLARSEDVVGAVADDVRLADAVGAGDRLRE